MTINPPNINNNNMIGINQYFFLTFIKLIISIINSIFKTDFSYYFLFYLFLSSMIFLYLYYQQGKILDEMMPARWWSRLLTPVDLRTSTSPVSVGIAVTSGNSAMTGESAIRRSGLPYFNLPPFGHILMKIGRKYTKRKLISYSFHLAKK